MDAARPWEEKSNIDLVKLLDYIDPAQLDYNDWLAVGMALKAEGYPLHAWDSWSVRDPARYKASGSCSCAAKWQGFSNTKIEGEVSAGTIVQMAKDRGWQPERKPDMALRWDDWLDGDDGDGIAAASYERAETIRPIANADGTPMTPQQMFIEYISTLYSSDEIIGYCARSHLIKGKYIPADKGVYTRTAGAVIAAAQASGIDNAIGTYDHAAGAWIRINPLDGNGIKNDNVAEFRYALVESDNMPIEIQMAKITDLNLPVAAIVHSGKKSIHAIVKIEAADRTEYRKRVERLYKYCSDNGFEVDTQNKNPSRLSRLPGAVRGENVQYLIALNQGAKSWDAWEEQLEEAELDTLPEIEHLQDVWAQPPEKAPEIIEGILREGHKMLVTGPSKAGKSMLLIELAISLSVGGVWLNHRCKKGKVLYLNLEIDKPSCIWRFVDISRSMGISAPPAVDIWHLRGTAQTLDKLAPKLIRRTKTEKYVAVIVDPIYKVITGDENNAADMAKFCGIIDSLCNNLGAAVIYCHHHSKGVQSNKKAMDRGSGSGVFARDMDALVDLLELELPQTVKAAVGNTAWCKKAMEQLRMHRPKLASAVPTDVGLVETQFRQWLESRLESHEMNALIVAAEAARKKETERTAWRISFTTREFSQPEDINLWYEFPVHRVDESGILSDIQPETEDRWKRGFQKMKQARAEKMADAADELTIAFDSLSENGEPVPVAELAEDLGMSEVTLRRRLGKSKQRNPEICKHYELVTLMDGTKAIGRKS